MASVTREALCRVKVCPHPTDPWYHVCEVCESPAVHHHHKEPKGMGGSKKRDVSSNIVMLCAIHHEQAHGIGVSTAEGESGGAEVPPEASHSPSAAGASVRTAPGRNPPVKDAGGRERGKAALQSLPLPRPSSSVPSRYSLEELRYRAQEFMDGRATEEAPARHIFAAFWAWLEGENNG